MGLREEVAEKTYGRCAYCGKELGAVFHLDHVMPKSRGGADIKSTLLAACSRCNFWKKSFTLDEFREEIRAQISRLTRDSAPFRLAWDFDRIVESPRPLSFFFEKMDPPLEIEE